MICENCRGEIPEGAKFCTVCGSHVAGYSEVREISAWAPPDIQPDSEAPADPKTAQEPELERYGESGHDENPIVISNPYKPRIYVDTFIPPGQIEHRSPQDMPSGVFDYSETHDPETVPGLMYEPPSILRKNAAAASSVPEDKMTFGQFFVMELLAMIPVVGLIIMCVWAFVGGVNANRSALAQAKLIIMLIMAFIINIVFIVLLVLISNGMITLSWLTLGQI